MEVFSSESFRSILIFPYLEVKKEKAWYIKLAITEKVYSYKYLFYLPEKFLTYYDKYDLRANIFFLLSFSTPRIKEILVKVVILLRSYNTY